MRATTRRELRAAIHEASRDIRNFRFWEQASRLNEDHPTIGAANVRWRAFHWLMRRTQRSWFARNVRDFLFEIIGRSPGQFFAKLLPLGLAGYVAAQIGDQPGQVLVAITSAVYLLLIMALGPIVWVIADIEEDGRSAREVVTNGRADYQNLVAWVGASERLLRDTANPSLPAGHIAGVRAAALAVRARIRRQPVVPAPVCSLTP